LDHEGPSTDEGPPKVVHYLSSQAWVSQGGVQCWSDVNYSKVQGEPSSSVCRSTVQGEPSKSE
jgi:hypothetical protein